MMQGPDTAEYPIEAIGEEQPGCGGCLLWLLRQSVLLVLLVGAVVAGLHLGSPVVEPCPLDAPPIPEAEVWRTAPDIYVDACVGVHGVVVSRELGGELIVEMDRGEYTLQLLVRGPDAVFEEVEVGEPLSLAGRIRKHEDGGSFVHHGVDYGWWGNLREHLEGVLASP